MAAQLDYEEKTEYNISVKVKDGGDPILSDKATVSWGGGGCQVNMIVGRTSYRKIIYSINYEYYSVRKKYQNRASLLPWASHLLGAQNLRICLKLSKVL